MQARDCEDRRGSQQTDENELLTSELKTHNRHHHRVQSNSRPSYVDFSSLAIPQNQDFVFAAYN